MESISEDQNHALEADLQSFRPPVFENSAGGPDDLKFGPVVESSNRNSGSSRSGLSRPTQDKAIQKIESDLVKI